MRSCVNASRAGSFSRRLSAGCGLGVTQALVTFRSTFRESDGACIASRTPYSTDRFPMAWPCFTVATFEIAAIRRTSLSELSATTNRTSSARVATTRPIARIVRADIRTQSMASVTALAIGVTAGFALERRKGDVLDGLSIGCLTRQFRQMHALTADSFAVEQVIVEELTNGSRE
jgi:hypothetical protein